MSIEQLNCSTVVCSEADELNSCDCIVLPGVGSFGPANSHMSSSRLKDKIYSLASSGIPILGICLGMQVLGQKSEEAPNEEGLCLIDGETLRLPIEKTITGRNCKFNVGWRHVTENTVHSGTKLASECTLKFYFVHGYYFQPTEIEAVQATYKWGDREYAALVQKKNIWGVQFHPEKSSLQGLDLLRKFLRNL